MRDAIFLGRLRRWELVVTLEHHLPVLEREDGVRSPFLLVRHATLWLTAAAPLIAEEDCGAVIVEGRRMPEGEVRVGHGPNADGMRGIGDVEEYPVPAARAARQADRRINRDVVTLC